MFNNTVRLKLNERAVVFRKGLPVRALGPGEHRLARLEKVAMLFDVDAVLFEARAEIRAVIPAEWFTEVAVANDQRAILFREGRPFKVLEAGMHRHWNADSTVEAAVYPVNGAPPEDARILSLLRDEVVQVIVGQHQRGLLFVQGRFERVLEPGRHLFWNTGEAPASVSLIDMRRQILPVAGQELMTRDKVTLRLSLAVEWSPMDPAIHQRVAADPKAALYAITQLALRDYVAGVTLDELLEGRDGLTRFMEAQMRPEAEQLGVRVTRVGLKDIVLPGDMKALLNRVIEAEKQAAANAILRREEAAHTRTQANAAQLMADRPMLLRLKELEALESIAGRIEKLQVVMGAAGIQKLLPIGDRGDR